MATAAPHDFARFSLRPTHMILFPSFDRSMLAALRERRQSQVKRRRRCTPSPRAQYISQRTKYREYEEPKGLKRKVVKGTCILLRRGDGSTRRRDSIKGKTQCRSPSPRAVLPSLPRSSLPPSEPSEPSEFPGQNGRIQRASVHPLRPRLSSPSRSGPALCFSMRLLSSSSGGDFFRS